MTQVTLRSQVQVGQLVRISNASFGICQIRHRGEIGVVVRNDRVGPLWLDEIEVLVGGIVCRV